MLRNNTPYLRALNFLLDIGLTVASLFAAAVMTLLIKGEPVPQSLATTVDYRQVTLIVLIWSCLIYLRGERYIYRLRQVKDFAAEAFSLAFYGTGLFLVFSYLLKLPVLPRTHVITFLICNLTALFLLRLILLKTLHYLRSHGFNCHQALVLGTRQRVKHIIDDVLDNKRWGIQVKGILSLRPRKSLYRYRDVPLIGSVADLEKLLKNEHIDYMMISVPINRLNAIRSAILTCEQAGVNVCLQTDFFPLATSRFAGIDFAGKPAIIHSRELEASTSFLAKQVADHVVAAVGLLLISPLMLLIAAAVRLTSKGPVFFKQIRCGLNGKRFAVLKFRTMVENAELLKEKLVDKNEMDGPVFKIKNDPRITPIGKVLRKLSLDELPQLINVVKGEMSLVGPRPPLPNEVSQYDIRQRRKLSVKPGLTCIWQVSDRNDTTFDKWMKQDLEYIDNWSLWLDAKILFKTIPAVINATGR